MLEELTDDGFPGELLGGEAAGGGGGEGGGRLGHERGFLVSGRSAIRYAVPLRFKVQYRRPGRRGRREKIVPSSDFSQRCTSVAPALQAESDDGTTFCSWTRFC